MSHERTPVTMVAGWHGSGKSVLIRRLADRIGVRGCPVVTSSPDALCGAQYVLRLEEEVVEQVPGCGFCAIRHDLICSLRSLCLGVDQPRHILIELSGWADPAIAAQTLLGDPYLAKTLELNALITVVDGSSLHVRAYAGQDFWPAGTMADQVALADIILINRTDGLTLNARKLAKTLVTETNPLATVIENRNDLALDLFLDVHAYRPAFCKRVATLGVKRSTPVDTATRGMVVNLVGRVDRLRFEHWAVSHDHIESARILRIVGLIYSADHKGPLLCQRVGTHLTLERDERWPEDVAKATRLFVSGRGLTPAMVLEGLHGCVAEPC